MLCLNFPCCSKHAVSSGRVAVLIGEIGFCGGFPSPDTPSGAGSLPWARGASDLVLLSVWTAVPPPQGKVALVFWGKGNPGTSPSIPSYPRAELPVVWRGPGLAAQPRARPWCLWGAGWMELSRVVPECFLPFRGGFAELQNATALGEKKGPFEGRGGGW